MQFLSRSILTCKDVGESCKHEFRLITVDGTQEIRSTTAQLSHTRSGHEATTAGWIFIALISQVDEHCAATSCLWQYHSACIAQLATSSKGVLVPKFNTMEKSMKNIMQMSRVSVHNKKM